MIEMKCSGKTVEIEAKGTMPEILNDYACMTASLMHSLLKPCNTENEYKRTAERMAGAFCAGMKQAMDRRRNEVLYESSE